MRKMILLGLALTLPASALAAEFQVDPSHSRVGFAIRHLMAKVRGEFRTFEGNFSFDPKKPEATQITFNVDTASVNTNDQKRDEHLRGEDFFHAEKNPKLTFVAKKMTADGKDKFKLAGDLTMRGVTKPVTFDVDYYGEQKDPWGNEKVGFQAVAKVNRKDWGISWNKALDAGGMIIGDDVEIVLDLEAAKNKKK